MSDNNETPPDICSVHGRLRCGECREREWLREENAKLKKVAELAQSLIERWYRDPPKAEYGDFLADMHRLSEALSWVNDYPSE